MYCPKCGRPNTDDAVRCANCGEVLKSPGATQRMQAQPTLQRPAQPQPPPPCPPQQPYQNPAYQYPPTAQADPGNTLSIIGIVLGAVSLLMYHLLFGIAGVTLGIIGLSKKERLGVIAIVVSAGCMIVGMIIRALVLVATLRAMQHLLPMPPH